MVARTSDVELVSHSSHSRLLSESAHPLQPAAQALQVVSVESKKLLSPQSEHVSAVSQSPSQLIAHSVHSLSFLVKPA